MLLKCRQLIDSFEREIMKKLLILLSLPLGLSASERSNYTDKLRIPDMNDTYMPSKPSKREVKEENKKQKPDEMNNYQPGKVKEEPMVRIGAIEVPLKVITAHALEQEKSNK